jgi:hypothetical protein
MSGRPHPACHGLHSELPRRRARRALGCWFWCFAIVADAVAAFISGGRVSTSFFVCGQSLVEISLRTVAVAQAWLGLERLLAACMRPSRAGWVLAHRVRERWRCCHSLLRVRAELGRHPTLHFGFNLGLVGLGMLVGGLHAPVLGGLGGVLARSRFMSGSGGVVSAWSSR